MQTNQPQNLNPTEVLQIVEKYEQMFATDGWKELIEDISAKSKTLFPSLMSYKSTDVDLNIAKGVNNVYQYLLGLEQMISSIKKNLELETETGNQDGDDVI